MCFCSYKEWVVKFFWGGRWLGSRDKTLLMELVSSTILWMLVFIWLGFMLYIRMPSRKHAESLKSAAVMSWVHCFVVGGWVLLYKIKSVWNNCICEPTGKWLTVLHWARMTCDKWIDIGFSWFFKLLHFISDVGYTAEATEVPVMKCIGMFVKVFFQVAICVVSCVC